MDLREFFSSYSSSSSSSFSHFFIISTNNPSHVPSRLSYALHHAHPHQEEAMNRRNAHLSLVLANLLVSTIYITPTL